MRQENQERGGVLSGRGGSSNRGKGGVNDVGECGILEARRRKGFQEEGQGAVSNDADRPVKSGLRITVRLGNCFHGEVEILSKSFPLIGSREMEHELQERWNQERYFD